MFINFTFSLVYRGTTLVEKHFFDEVHKIYKISIRKVKFVRSYVSLYILLFKVSSFQNPKPCHILLMSSMPMKNLLRVCFIGQGPTSYL